MPLPLIPLIVIGATAASAALAGKKGIDSAKNMKETKAIASSLESIYKDAYQGFEIQREETNAEFESYGLQKLEILDGSMKSFVDVFKQIKNVEFNDQAVTDELIQHSDVDEMVWDIEQQVVKAGQVLTAGLASLAGGGLAAMGAVGATTTFAAASTGTAIAALSGIAMKNATLAFLGGGALSAGGFGIAGGTMVLGGIAIAPALAIGSLIFASSTEKKLEQMHAKKAEINTEIEKLKSAVTVMAEIKGITQQMQELAVSTNTLFIKNISRMEQVISSKGMNFNVYTEGEQRTIFNNYKLAVILKDLLNTTILDEQGGLMENLQTVLELGKKELKNFEVN